MNGFLRLSEAPALVVRIPECGACEVEVYSDGWDQWVCPSCGTEWRTSDGDGEVGELDKDADGPEVATADAWQVSGFSEPDRSQMAAKLRANRKGATS